MSETKRFPLMWDGERYTVGGPNIGTMEVVKASDYDADLAALKKRLEEVVGGSLRDGFPTGLMDSNGRMIRVGDMLRKPVDCNADFHGTWAIYRVKLQGIVPIIAYVESEKGKLLPEGYLASPLSDEYDRKMFVFANDVSTLQPESELLIVQLPLTAPTPPGGDADEKEKG